MTKQYTVSAEWFDTCYVDYLTDHTGIVVGVERAGQTRDDLIEQVTDEVYEQEDFPLGDYAYHLLREAVAGCVPEHVKVSNRHPMLGPFRFWPIDENGKEIISDDSEIYVPEEQPSAWFRITLTEEPLKIKLSTNDDDNGSVLVICDDKEAAKDDQSIDGSSWECPSDMDEAYTVLQDRQTLLADLEKEGYDVDSSEYSAPDEEDCRFWYAKVEYDNGEPAEQLRDTLGWKHPMDVTKNRRVQDQCHRMPDNADFPSYHQACWDSGFVLDGREWLKSRK